MLKTAKIIGFNTDIEAALALICKSPTDYSLFIVLSCATDDAFSRLKQALSEAEAVFYTSSEVVSERVKAAFEAIIESLKDTENVQVLVGSTKFETSEKVFYLIRKGDGIRADLIRSGKTSNLSESVGETELLSGFLKPGDRVIMQTHTLQEVLQNNLELLRDTQIDEIEDEVASRLPQAHPLPIAAIVMEDEAPVPQDEVETSAETVTESFKEGFRFHFSPPRLPKITIRSRKSLAALFVVIITALGLFTAFFITNRQKAEVQAKLEISVNEANKAFAKAQQEKDSDQQAALADIQNAKKHISEALKINPSHAPALELQKQVEASVGDVLKVYQISDFPLWLELDLIKKNMKAIRMSYSLGKVLLLDPDLKVLTQIDLSNKSNKIIAGEDKIDNSIIASLNGDAAFSYAEKSGITRIDTGNSQSKVVVKSDKEWGGIIDLVGFAGNIYLLDKNNNQIWKYLPIVEGYSDKRSYLSSEVKVDYTEAIKMLIDSSVWVLKGPTNLEKYTQGNTDYFAVSGLSEPIKQIKNFFVSDDTENLYLIDSGNNRLVVLDKKGVYKAQYQSERFGSFVDFVVDEKGQKVYLLDGAKIFTMDLR